MDAQELLDMVAAYGSEGVDAGTPSEQTGLWRDRLTALINPLVREGRLLRQGGVRYDIACRPRNRRQRKPMC